MGAILKTGQNLVQMAKDTVCHAAFKFTRLALIEDKRVLAVSIFGLVKAEYDRARRGSTAVGEGATITAAAAPSAVPDLHLEQESAPQRRWADALNIHACDVRKVVETLFHYKRHVLTTMKASLEEEEAQLALDPPTVSHPEQLAGAFAALDKARAQWP